MFSACQRLNRKTKAAGDRHDIGVQNRRVERFHRFFDGPDRYEAPEGGESFGQVRDRTGAFLEELARRPEYADGQILLATHGAALAGLLCYIRRAPLADYWGVGVHKNCAVTEVEAKDGSFRILSENVVYYKDKVDPWAK